MEEEKATQILSEYFKLRHGISNFNLLNIQDNIADIYLIATDNIFSDPYVSIHLVDFRDKEVTGTIDMKLAEMYVSSEK